MGNERTGKDCDPWERRLRLSHSLFGQLIAPLEGKPSNRFTG